MTALVLLAACSGSPPETLGLHKGRLAPCPPSPNCVSSQAAEPAQHIAALPLQGSREQTRRRLLELIQAQPRARVSAQQAGYLRAEFSSLVFRFVDDVEFLIGEQAVEVRSASRLGHADFGVNRRRIERLREGLRQP